MHFTIFPLGSPTNNLNNAVIFGGVSRYTSSVCFRVFSFFEGANKIGKFSRWTGTLVEFNPYSKIVTRWPWVLEKIWSFDFFLKKNVTSRWSIMDSQTEQLKRVIRPLPIRLTRNHLFWSKMKFFEFVKPYYYPLVCCCWATIAYVTVEPSIVSWQMVKLPKDTRTKLWWLWA